MVWSRSAKPLIIYVICSCLILATGFTIPSKPAVGVIETETEDVTTKSPLPVVMWHGLGDYFSSSFMLDTAELIRTTHPGIFVHSIRLSESPSQDQRLGFNGNLTSQLIEVCQQLNRVPELSNGFDALGFSQGGLFLRGYMERCTKSSSSSLTGDDDEDENISMCGGCWGPPIRNLITFGSPHNGVADLPNSWRWWGGLRWRSAVWRDWTQGHIVVSQYYRDPNSDTEYENYLEHSNFLADINNEREKKSESYANNLANLNKLVLIMFEDDEMIKPKVSSWFWEFNTTAKSIIKLEDRSIYKQDWIGLKQLDQDNKIVNMLVKGGHMEVTDDLLSFIAKTYLGRPARKSLYMEEPVIKFVDQTV